jgi:4-oxalocrotonate tautomerase family enzyme
VPIVIVETWVGKTDTQKATIIKGITQAFVDIGEAPDQVKIVIHEIPKENWVATASKHPNGDSRKASS